MMLLLLVSLATFWAWETLLGLLPFRSPRILQPIIVATLAHFLSLLPAGLLLAAAAAGVVGLLHLLTSVAGVVIEPAVWWVPNVRFRRRVRASRLPKLP